MRQRDDVFVDSVTDVIEDDENAFDTIGGNNFSDPLSPKKNSSPKQSPFIRRSKRIKKDNTRLNKVDWFLTSPSKTIPKSIKTYC